jgi:urease accessory protein
VDSATSLPVRGSDVLPLLRLVQLADSGLPIGSFAYSHGLETLLAEQWMTTEHELAELLPRFVAQSLRHQQLPACFTAWAARSLERVFSTDRRLDASFSLPGERQSSCAVGRRLAKLAGEVDASLADHPYLAAVTGATAPGHHSVVFGVIARALRIDAPATLGAFGFGAIQSLLSAATRLGFIGHAASTRLAASVAPALAASIEAVLARPPASHFGSWIPDLEIGAARHPNLPFRMFAT